MGIVYLHMVLWYINMSAFPSPNDSTSSYTPGSNVSYPAHKLLATLFHITLLKSLLRYAVIHAHTYTVKFYLTHFWVLGLWQWQLQMAMNVCGNIFLCLPWYGCIYNAKFPSGQNDTTPFRLTCPLHCQVPSTYITRPVPLLLQSTVSSPAYFIDTSAQSFIFRLSLLQYVWNFVKSFWEVIAAPVCLLLKIKTKQFSPRCITNRFLLTLGAEAVHTTSGKVQYT
jgi:hypothetical protein